MKNVVQHHGDFKPKARSCLAAYSVDSHLSVQNHQFRLVGTVAADIVADLKRRLA